MASKTTTAMQKRQTKHETHSLRVELQYMDGWTVGRGEWRKTGKRKYDYTYYQNGCLTLNIWLVFGVSWSVVVRYMKGQLCNNSTAKYNKTKYTVL